MLSVDSTVKRQQGLICQTVYGSLQNLMGPEDSWLLGVHKQILVSIRGSEVPLLDVLEDLPDPVVCPPRDPVASRATHS